MVAMLYSEEMLYAWELVFAPLDLKDLGDLGTALFVVFWNSETLCRERFNTVFSLGEHNPC